MGRLVERLVADRAAERGGRRLEAPGRHLQAAGRQQRRLKAACQLLAPHLGPLPRRHPGQELAAVGGQRTLQVGQRCRLRAGMVCDGERLLNVLTSQTCPRSVLKLYRPSE